MPIINNPFNGKLNLDVAQYRISNGDYIDALNITKDSEGVGNDLVVANILGNTNIPYTLPAGENKVIGFYPDKVRDRAYYFLWNSNGYNSILYYNASTKAIVKVLKSKTDSDGIDILSFNPSYKVLSVNIFYRDDEGDLLFFNDGLNPPKVINVSDNYGTSWKLEYILVAKAPPIMPPKVVYENDTTVNVNNIRNTLFQFCYRYVYDNNEKSVWSARSIVPLPQQDTLLLTNDIPTNNARISVSTSTGGVDVRAIEIAFRETTNGFTSDWYLIGSFNKDILSIPHYDLYNYRFYNDGIYSQIDVLETEQLQDYVPQKANAAELANGNVLLYSGLTEGYNKTSMKLVSVYENASNNYYFDKCGLLFFATSSGLDSGVDGTILKIYIYGTGTNSAGIITILDNAAGIYVVNVINSAGTSIGVSYTNNANNTSVITLLSDISNAFTTNGGGWTQVSRVNNVLTLSNSSTFKLLSSGVKILFPASAPDNTVFANAFSSGYQYAVQYFDYLGRTIGAQTDIDASFTTPSLPTSYNYPITKLQIKNRPPLEASYYHVLRSNNTTYNKRLFWISKAAYASTSVDTTVQRFAYIDISNIDAYNELITSTQGVVSYNFTQGDRITFLARYNSSNTQILFTTLYDYEVLGTNAVITLGDGTVKTGNFVKIAFPSGTGSDIMFTGDSNYLHYQIFLYNYTSNSSSTQKFFYEVGKCFGIGNVGTNNAYHIGLEQTQSASSPESVPAIVSLTNGDLFWRKRKVSYSDEFVFTAGGTSQDINSLMQITVTGSPITTSAYIVKTQAFNSNLPANYPTYVSTNFFFNNLLTTDALLVRLSGEFSVFQSQANNNTTFSIKAIVITASTSILLDLTKTEVVQSQIVTNFILDNTISIPATAKVWIAVYSQNSLPNETFTLNTFNLNFNVLKNYTIPIIEKSFNDTYNLVTNSNGRVSVVDENAKQTYFPTLIRFGGAYQVNTNINQINNFKYENFDEYDRSFGDVIRLHVRDRYLKVYQKFKVGNVPILTQIVKDSANNPLQANTDVLINKIQYYAGDYGIGDAATSLAWNNFADYFVDNYRGVVCRLSQDGITPISIINKMNAFFVATLSAYRQELNNGIVETGVYMGNPCIYGVFDAYTNKYIIAMEEINRYTTSTTTTTTAAPTTTTTAGPTTTTTTTTSGPTTTTTTSGGTTTTTTTLTYCQSIGAGAGCFNWDFTAGATGAIVQWTDCNGNNQTRVLNEGESGNACLCDGATPNVLEGSLATISQVGQCVNTTTTTTTTPPTTTTTLPPFQGLVCLSSAGGGQEEACYDCPQSFIMTGNQPTFCDSTIFTADEWFYTVTTGDYWLSYNGFVVRVTHTSGQDFATKISAGCQTCPPNISTTTTTSAPIYSYYIATRCDDSFYQQYFRTTGSYPQGASVKYQGYCWEIQEEQGTSGFTPESNHIDCIECNATLPTTTTTTTTAAPTTTTTTNAPFTACMSDFSDQSACNCDGLSYGTWTFNGSGSTICTSTTISSTGILSEIENNGFFWIASGGNVRYYQKNGTTSSATAQAACYACPTTTTTTTTIAPTTTTTTVAVEWYDLLLCSNLTTHKTSEQYTTGTFVINERVETVFPIDTYRIVGVYTTNPGGVKDLIVPTGFTGCPTTTTTTTCNPTPNWVNNGAVFCSACVSYQPQIDTNPCSPTYNTTRNFSLGAGAPCDYTANWVNNGAAFCSACVSYQPQIDNNPCSATYNTTRNFNLGASAPCNYSPNFVNTGTTCVGVDLYNVQTDNNPCSPTYNQTQLGSLIQANSPTCGYTTTTTTTAAPVNVVVSSFSSVDVSFIDITVNSVVVTYVSGDNLPVDAGEQGTFQTTQTGTQTVTVYYTSSTSGQNITLTDSNGGGQCQDTSPGSNTMIFNSVAVNASGNVSITASNGTCS